MGQRVWVLRSQLGPTSQKKKKKISLLTWQMFAKIWTQWMYTAGVSPRMRESFHISLRFVFGLYAFPSLKAPFVGLAWQHPCNCQTVKCYPILQNELFLLPIPSVACHSFYGYFSRTHKLDRTPLPTLRAAVRRYTNVWHCLIYRLNRILSLFRPYNLAPTRGLWWKPRRPRNFILGC